ncbi:hypothetical protein D0B32_24080 [Paraburkholderia sp. DHOC27]|nr:hypothetical protein D0B32_24080 [Paraburkholderia sp. DHOC27]
MMRRIGGTASASKGVEIFLDVPLNLLVRWSRSRIWRRRIKKVDAQGIHGTIFYELDEKKVYYPTRKDEEAINPDGTLLRSQS